MKPGIYFSLNLPVVSSDPRRPSPDTIPCTISFFSPFFSFVRQNGCTFFPKPKRKKKEKKTILFCLCFRHREKVDFCVQNSSSAFASISSAPMYGCYSISPFFFLFFSFVYCSYFRHRFQIVSMLLEMFGFFVRLKATTANIHIFCLKIER